VKRVYRPSRAENVDISLLQRVRLARDLIEVVDAQGEGRLGTRGRDHNFLLALRFEADRRPLSDGRGVGAITLDDSWRKWQYFRRQN
jgi:hypothetical protein